VAGLEYRTHGAYNKYVEISDCKTEGHLVDQDVNWSINIEVGIEVAASVGVDHDIDHWGVFVITVTTVTFT
jgi:hypothetical protein